MKVGINEFMKGIVWAVIGWALCFHWYSVEGLWGVQNAALHTERVVVPTLAKTAVVASKACENNAGVAKDNEASPTDLSHCPSAAKVYATVPKQIAQALPK